MVCAREPGDDGIHKWGTNRASPVKDEPHPLVAEVFGIDCVAVAHLGWSHWLPSRGKPLPLGPDNAVPLL